MKRAITLLFLTLFAFVAPLATAGEWVTEELRWHRVNQGPYTTSTTIFVRDTTFARFAGVVTSDGGDLDTTSAFKAYGAAVVGRGVPVGVAGPIDSLLLGWIIIQGDSTIASTYSTGTLAIDGRFGGFGSPLVETQWVPVDTVSSNATAANSAVAVFPIRAQGSTSGGPKSLLAFNALRARAVAGVGIMYSARVFWKYWKP